MNIWKYTTVGLAIALGLVISGPGINTASADEQPVMERALEHLELAEKALDNANTDKGGFRVKALRGTREAIKHVKAGIKYDNQHKSKEEKDKKKD